MARKSVGGPYPDNWKAIATAVKDLADWRCIRCGHPDGDRTHRNPLPKGAKPGPLYEPYHNTFVDCDERCTHPKDWSVRMLTVHHLDMHPSNCAWWNLAALCQVCHLKIQAKVIMERPYFLEHSAWFKPYVAGYYAHEYGRPEDRPYVHEHIEELITLGQAVKA